MVLHPPMLVSNVKMKVFNHCDIRKGAIRLCCEQDRIMAGRHIYLLAWLEQTECRFGTVGAANHDDSTRDTIRVDLDKRLL